MEAAAELGSPERLAQDRAANPFFNAQLEAIRGLIQGKRECRYVRFGPACHEFDIDGLPFGVFFDCSDLDYSASMNDDCLGDPLTCLTRIEFADLEYLLSSLIPDNDWGYDRHEKPNPKDFEEN